MRTTSPARVLRRAFIGAAVTWTLLLPLATLTASRAHPSPIAYLFALLVYGAGSFVCHQLPERSFQLWAHQMPVCARCTGIYAGAAIGAVCAMAARLPPSRASRFGGPGKPCPPNVSSGAGHRFNSAGLALFGSALPSLLTLVYEWTTGQTPSNWIRASAGVPIGVVVASLVVAATENQVN